MADNDPKSDSADVRAARPEAQSASGPLRPWLLLAAIILATGGAVALALRLRSPQQSNGGPLDGKLTVLVRPPDRAIEPVAVEEKGAVPVRSGGAMCLDVQLNQPAFMYLVWLDSAGEVLPLYPWNNERLEVKDVNQPPPLRRAGKLVFSPLLGGSWTFGERGGMETVLLLARRTPLGEDTNLAALLAPLPPARQRHPNEVAILSLDGGANLVSVLLSAANPGQRQLLAVDDPLGQLMVRLGKHFELIRAVRFAHAEDGGSGKEGRG